MIIPREQDNVTLAIGRKRAEAEGFQVKFQVADAEDQLGRDLEAFLQAAVEVHADQPERYAHVGPPGPAGVAATARQQGPDRDPVAFFHAVRVPGVFDDRGHLVTLDPRVEVACAGKRAHVARKEVEVGSADANRLRPHDNVPGTGLARSGNVFDHHLTRCPGHCGQHIQPLSCGSPHQRE